MAVPGKFHDLTFSQPQQARTCSGAGAPRSVLQIRVPLVNILANVLVQRN